MKLAKYKAVICEGAAEEAVIDLLIDEHLLVFEREDLLEESILRCRNAKSFENRYLRKSFDDKISVLRILDSRKERFNLSKEYSDKVDVVNIITAPEIEMLIIHAENKYDLYKKSGKKPSAFCKEDLKMHSVKNYAFVKEYFNDCEKLLNAIALYNSKTAKKKTEYNLSDIIKKDLSDM